MNAEINRSEETICAYIKRGEQLWNRAANAHQVPCYDLKANQFIHYLVALLPTLKKASRRQYLASAREYANKLVDHQSNEMQSPFIQLHELKELSDLKASNFESSVMNKKNTSLNTSSQKAKQIKNTDLNILIENIKFVRSKWIKPAMVWMMANILVGLRPCEWRDAELFDEENNQIILRVKNAKNTNDRSHGEFRLINCSNLALQELALIKKHLSISVTYNIDDKSWQNYYDGCRKLIHKITRKYLSKSRKYPSLYSSRHQFAANAKSSSMTKIELAALMGHATDETAGFHYGKKKFGSGKCKVKANEFEMRKIRVSNSIIKTLKPT